MEFTFEWIELLLVAPAISLFLASLIPLTIKVLNGNKEPSSFATLLYGLIGVVAAAGTFMAKMGTHKTIFEGALVFDGISSIVGLVIISITGLALVFSRENLSTNNRQYSEQVFLILNAAAGMLLVTWSNDLIFFFVGVELMSLCLYILIALSSEGRLSKEAAFKYFILGAFASAILLYGIAFIFGTAGTTNLPQIAEVGGKLVEVNRLFLLGLIFVIIGLCFKVSIFPFHAWTPDVYQGAPTPITAFMATGVKAAVFAVFLRILMTDAMLGDQAHRLTSVLQWLAVLTMLAGNIAAVMQNNLKRMLAYSSVAHSGYVMIGLIVTSISGQDNLGNASVLFYIIGYTVMTIGAFGLLNVFEKDEESSLDVNDLKGLAKRRPWLSLCFTVLMLSLAGVPPTIGFFGKFFIFTAALQKGFLWLALWGVVGSVISVYYYLRPVVVMYMSDEEGVDTAPDRYMSIWVVSAAAILVVVMGLFSSPLYNFVTAAVR